MPLYQRTNDQITSLDVNTLLTWELGCYVLYDADVRRKAHYLYQIEQTSDEGKQVFRFPIRAINGDRSIFKMCHQYCEKQGVFGITPIRSSC